MTAEAVRAIEKAFYLALSTLTVAELKALTMEPYADLRL